MIYRLLPVVSILRHTISIVCSFPEMMHFEEKKKGTQNQEKTGLKGCRCVVHSLTHFSVSPLFFFFLFSVSSLSWSWSATPPSLSNGLVQLCTVFLFAFHSFHGCLCWSKFVANKKCQSKVVCICGVYFFYSGGSSDIDIHWCSFSLQTSTD